MRVSQSVVTRYNNCDFVISLIVVCVGSAGSIISYEYIICCRRLYFEDNWPVVLVRVIVVGYSNDIAYPSVTIGCGIPLDDVGSEIIVPSFRT